MRRFLSNYFDLLLLITSASEFRFTAANNVFFFSAYSLKRGRLCCKQACTVTVIHYCTDDRQLLIAHCNSHGLIASYSSRIAICATAAHLHSTPPLGGPRQNIAMPFGTEKLEWCSYPTVKNVEDMFIRFHRIHERDRHIDRRTDRQTPHDGIGRAYA